jgi:hypothetical protein
MRKFLNRIDPFDNIGLLFSPLRLALHRYGNTLMLAFALVAIALVPAQAMEYYGAHGGTWVSRGAVTNPLGLLGVMVAGATAQPKQKLPFRYGTVRRRLTIGTYTLTPGQSIPTITLPQVGMLSRIVVNIAGTYTKANASGLNLLDGYDAILARNTLKLNNGSSQIFDASGVGINIVNQNQSPSLPIKRGLLTTVAAQTFTYNYMIPVAANNREQFTMGLINLQAPELRATLDISANPLSSIFATPADVTLFTATATVSYEYFEIPNLSEYQLPPMTLVRTIEEAPIPVAVTGLQTYQIPRLGTMIDYHAVLQLNNVYANVLTNFTNFALRYNKSDTQYDMRVQDCETYEAEQYGMGSGPTKTFMQASALSFNLWAAGNRPWDGGDFRDAIDTEENTTTESLITVNGATALNPGKDNIFYVRRVVQRIVQAPAPA